MDNDKPVTITVDAMGGDDAPEVVLKGVESALSQDASLSILLVGNEDVVVPFASQHERVVARVSIETIGMGEHPVSAIRAKKDSSIVVGCQTVKDGSSQGFFSAGSTGACLAAATLVIGRIHGIRRPAIASVIPTPTKPVVLCDIGANPDCKPEYLLQFAQMAEVYARLALGYEHPRVALLNNGSEETKGSNLTQAAYVLLKEKLPDFAGNAEGRDIMNAAFDVFVTDGFTGNIVLKTLEGTTKTIFKVLKDVIMSSTKTKLAGAALKPGIKGIMENIDADAHGAAPLLGIDGVCMIGHGASNEKAIASGILQTAREVRHDLIGAIGAMATE